MNTMKWLLKREYWEHKGGFFWAPAVVGSIMTLFLLVSMVIGVGLGKHHGLGPGHAVLQRHIYGVGQLDPIDDLALDVGVQRPNRLQHLRALASLLHDVAELRVHCPDHSGGHSTAGAVGG